MKKQPQLFYDTLTEVMIAAGDMSTLYLHVPPALRLEAYQMIHAIFDTWCGAYMTKEWKGTA